MPEIADDLRLTIAQLNPTMGDIEGNLALARRARAQAAEDGAHLLVLTELFLSGYSPEDLVLRPSFLAACRRAAESLAADTADGGPGALGDGVRHLFDMTVRGIVQNQDFCHDTLRADARHVQREARA